MVTIIDYGLGNLRSVQKAFEHLGATANISADPREIARAAKLVLPGVGAFAAGMEGLRARGLVEPILRAIQNGAPFFGICLGMQLLFESSEETGDGLPNEKGLGALRGTVVRLRGEQLIVPHMGWNQIEKTRAARVLRGVADGAYGYFVHSYVCAPRDPTLQVAETDYGAKFPSVIARENIWGIQFHPEKSQAVGLKILRNFLDEL